MPRIPSIPARGRLLRRRLISYAMSALVMAAMIYVLTTGNPGSMTYEFHNDRHAQRGTQVDGSQVQAPPDVIEVLLNTAW